MQSSVVVPWVWHATNDTFPPQDVLPGKVYRAEDGPLVEIYGRRPQMFIDPRLYWFYLFGSYATCVIQIVCPRAGEGKDCMNIYEDINTCVLAGLFSFT